MIKTIRYGSSRGDSLATRLRTLIVLRLLVAAFFVFAGHKLFEVPALPTYSVILVICFLTLGYAFWLSLRRSLGVLAAVQIAVDLLLETAMVHYTGGLDSAFVTLYVLSILSAAMVLSRRASLVATAVASGLYLAVVFLQFAGLSVRWFPPLGNTGLPPRQSLHFFYMSYVNVTFLWVVGFLSAYLARVIHRMEEHLKTREKLSLMGELTAHIAHEIRNPLATISGSLELLKEEMRGALSAEQSQLFDAVTEESQRLHRILNQILDFARSEEIRASAISLTQLLDEVFLLIEHTPRFSESVQIEKRYRDVHVAVLADRQKLKQVFLNLVYNALEAMKEGGTLTVDATPTSRGVSVGFRDTGPGMDAKTLRSLFIPFKTTKPKGTGIGLATVYRIVAGHGGTIDVESEVGKGSSFVISLPAA